MPCPVSVGDALQALSRSWLPMTPLAVVGYAPSLFIGAPPASNRAWPGSPAPVREQWTAREHDTGVMVGVCTIRSILSACRRRVAPLMVQFPPFAGGEVAVRGQ